MHNYIHTYWAHGNMADEEVARSIDEALNKIVTTADQRFVKMQARVEEVIWQKGQTEKKVQAMNSELDSCIANNNKNAERRLETPREKGGGYHTE